MPFLAFIPVIGPWLVSTTSGLLFKILAPVIGIAAIIIGVLIYLGNVRDEAARAAIAQLTVQISQAREQERARQQGISRAAEADSEAEANRIIDQKTAALDELDRQRTINENLEKALASKTGIAPCGFNAERLRKSGSAGSGKRQAK